MYEMNGGPEGTGGPKALQNPFWGGFQWSDNIFTEYRGHE